MPTYGTRCGVYPANGIAGDEVSSTYEGRHLTFLESELTHPSHADSLVDKGDPVMVGENIIGISFESAVAATDLIAIDTEGVWNISVVATNNAGNIAVAPGDELYINKSTCIVSKNFNKNVSARFGYALGTITSGQTAVIAVKLHWGGDDSEELVGIAGGAFTSATAKNFREYRYQCSAASGAAQGIYNRLYLTGAGTLTANSLRTYTDIVGVSIGNAYGAHISLGMGESTTVGSVTGLGVAVRATLGLPSGALPAGGTYAAVMAEIFSFGASADPTAATRLSFIRCVNGGDGTGIGKVDDKAYLLDLNGFSVGGGNVFVASTTESNYAYAARCYLDGVGDVWLMFASASG